jgi:hypothetical protein
MNRSFLATRALAAGFLAWAVLAGLPDAVLPSAVAQDDALDKLLEKLDEKPKPASTGGEAEKKPQEPKPPGQMADGDQDLDDLLKKLGDGDADRPDTTGPARPGAGAGKPKPDTPDALKGDDQGLDKRLEEMVRKKNPEKEKQEQQQDGQQGGEGQSKSSDDSPLGQAIKKMEEARQRLSKQDTGAETRKTQGEVVKQLDQILEQMRKAQAQRQQERQQKLSMRTRQAGQKPGQQQQGQQQEDGQQGNNAQGVGPQAPKKPTVSDVLVGAKDTWGDLPPHLREEMENVFREEMLPAKRDLIIRYYSSVARKGRAQSGDD